MSSNCINYVVYTNINLKRCIININIHFFHNFDYLAIYVHYLYISDISEVNFIIELQRGGETVGILS